MGLGLIVWLSLVLLGLHAAYAGQLVADVKTIASDGAILNAAHCRVSAVTMGPVGSAPVLSGTIDCRPDTLFGAGFE